MCSRDHAPAPAAVVRAIDVVASARTDVVGGADDEADAGAEEAEVGPARESLPREVEDDAPVPAAVHASDELVRSAGLRCEEGVIPGSAESARLALACRAAEAPPSLAVVPRQVDDVRCLLRL